jgi:hypothetical protein
MRIVAIATLLVGTTMISGCSNPNGGLASVSHGPRNEIGASCAALASRKWDATLTRASGATPKYILNVVGEVDLPTPGYTPVWKMGVSDRANPPGLQLLLSFDPPKEVDTQVVTINPVRFSMEVSSSRLRYIMVKCGDATLARIPDIGG